MGYEPHFCDSEEEARNKKKELIKLKKMALLSVFSDTTGEKKSFEEFFTIDDILDMERFRNIGIIKDSKEYNPEKLSFFISEIEKLRSIKNWKKEDLVNLFENTLENFKHTENIKNLDQNVDFLFFILSEIYEEIY